MKIKEEIERLSQKKNIESFERKRKMTDMVTVYQGSESYDSDHYHSLWPALVPVEEKEKILSDVCWDLSQDSGKPVNERYFGGGSDYLRYGNDKGIEPLIISRDFHGLKEERKEISEEFRLYHNLFYDEKNNNYLKINSDGNETIVITMDANVIKIRLKELSEFISVKEMILSLQFDYREHSTSFLSSLDIEEGSGTEAVTDRLCWACHYGDFSGFSSFHAYSRLLGKCLISPISKEAMNKQGVGHAKQYMDFIIDVDDLGVDVTHTCNPEALANFFGKNEGAPNYLTPVSFRKSVLDKYYQEPSKYSVEDSQLRCGNLWGLQLDNHHDEEICVWLGDLGRDLSYEEQLYWRSYNISSDNGVSQTFYQRQVLAVFANSGRPEHLFINKYNDLKNICKTHLKWPLLLPLDDGDLYHLECLRVPSTNEQRDFDSVVLSLTKILIDSLNEKKINTYIEPAKRNDLKGSINRLEAVFHIVDYAGFEQHIAFLRKLQNLRSTSTAHRKGSSYKKIAKELGFKDSDFKYIFSEILVEAVSFLEFLTVFVKEGKEGLANYKK